ncbi:cysteine-rich motor neuron 1 protein-like isoform X1 [Branchiostoma floridae x Branchiostoma belcheri]
MGTLLGALLLLAAVRSVAALSCLPCDRSQCPPPPSCPADVVKDVCGCCAACAKVEGERCGGPWRITGTCSSGLTCNKDPNDFNTDGVCVVDGAQQCPSGSRWSYCGSACPATCDERPMFCTQQCVARCVCDDRTHVWHNNVCIPPGSCPRQFCEYNGRRYKVGESWGVRETAGKNCLCDGRGERCLFVDCSPGSEHYLTTAGTWDCRPVRGGTCPRGYTKLMHTSGKSPCYRFVRKPATYGEAAASCRADGGRLVTIRTPLAQFRVTILAFLKIHAGSWIGLSDRGRAGTLVWSDGVKYNGRRYSHWGPRYWNTPGYNCVYLVQPLYRWQRGRCGLRRAYICEYNPYN